MWYPIISRCCSITTSTQRDDLGTALKLCEELGVPIAAHKTEGPSTVITFLGIEVDTVDRVLRLPEEKLQRLQREVER